MRPRLPDWWAFALLCVALFAVLIAAPIVLTIRQR
jgi:hypothetical protein